MSEQKDGGKKITYSGSGVNFESTEEEDLNWWELRKLAQNLNKLFKGEKPDRTSVKKAHDALASTSENDTTQS